MRAITAHGPGIAVASIHCQAGAQCHMKWCFLEKASPVLVARHHELQFCSKANMLGHHMPAAVSLLSLDIR